MIEISGEKRQDGLEEMLEVTMAKNFSILRSDTNQRFREKKNERTLLRINNNKNYIWEYYIQTALKQSQKENLERA